jgi:hypothetical protein
MEQQELDLRGALGVAFCLRHRMQPPSHKK